MAGIYWRVAEKGANNKSLLERHIQQHSHHKSRLLWQVAYKERLILGSTLLVLDNQAAELREEEQGIHRKRIESCDKNYINLWKSTKTFAIRFRQIRHSRSEEETKLIRSIWK